MFNAFKLAWINTYLDPPNFIIYNYGINFNFKEFRILLKSISSIPKLVLIKAYHSINKVERYHRPLHYTYKIIIAKQLELFDAN